jgi:histidinol dehydrogenase
VRIIPSTDTRSVARVLGRTAKENVDVARRARRIVTAVRRRGDAALEAYARRFDGLGDREPLWIEAAEIRSAARAVDGSVRRAIRTAAANIERVARAEVVRSRTVRVTAGVSIQLRASALQHVGCYVPAGRHPLVSSLLMTAVPARVAGVPDIVVACPRPVPAVLYAARLAGVRRVLRAGGAHAIAALAYGTESVPRMDKIVGPGNAYVAAAKALVASDCAIDFYAGPTELVVISRDGNPEWIAADLLAQAEHDPDARAILITTSASLAREVSARVKAGAPAFGAAAQSVRRHGIAIVAASLREAVALAERLAPEHLLCDDEAVGEAVRSAGTIFVGRYSVPALGDYATGSNHVLPTAGAARARGGLGAADFMKITSVQRLTRAGAATLRDVATVLARVEGLEAHARSIEVRQ